MKRMSCLLAIAAPLLLMLPAVAQAVPLQAGAYSWGSRYIQIARKGDRWCFQGFSARATSIASLSPDAKRPGLYRLHGPVEALVRQDNAKQLSYGSPNNLMPYASDREFGSEITPEMQKCLNAKTPYFKQIQSTR